MKKFITLILIIAGLTSCYKDNATYTFEVSGTEQSYVVSYQDKHGKWIENQTVQNGWAYYAEHDSDFRLKLNVIGNSIVVKLYKRSDVIKTYTGTGELIINETIRH